MKVRVDREHGEGRVAWVVGERIQTKNNTRVRALSYNYSYVKMTGRVHLKHINLSLVKEILTDTC